MTNKTWKKEWKKPEEKLEDNRSQIVEKVLANMIEAEKNGVSYKRGWFVSNELPLNARTGKHYSGMNILSCLSSNFEDPRFLTSKDVSDLYKESNGAIKIRKGEKATKISFTSTTTKVVENKDGDEEEKESRFTKYYSVFNLAQLEGGEELEKLFPRNEKRVMNEIDENQFITDLAEALKGTGLKIEHRASGNARYIPSLDIIEMPEPHRFRTSSDYYRTLLHEMGHSMGHKSRCDREQTGAFGSKEYAYEELCAELSSKFLGMETGVPYDSRTLDNHDSYLNSWIKIISADPTDKERFLTSAASKAFKSYDYAMTKLNDYRASKQVQSVEVTQDKAEIKKEPLKAPEAVERKKSKLSLAM